jgi:hypothetical protein
MTATRFFTGLAAAAVLPSLLFTACLAPDGTDAEGLSLTGHVVGSGGMPVAGVVVASALTGQRDTTDAGGEYILQAGRDDRRLAKSPDTLRFTRGGQVLAVMTVAHWSDEPADIRLVQRDIGGFLTAGAHHVARIELVMTGDGIDSAMPVVTEAYHNVAASNYSVYAFFPPSPEVMRYEVFVNVYGPDGALLGRSEAVSFNSFAGDITVPALTLPPTDEDAGS